MQRLLACFDGRNQISQPQGEKVQRQQYLTFLDYFTLNTYKNTIKSNICFYGVREGGLLAVKYVLMIWSLHPSCQNEQVQNAA